MALLRKTIKMRLLSWGGASVRGGGLCPFHVISSLRHSVDDFYYMPSFKSFRSGLHTQTASYIHTGQRVQNAAARLVFGLRSHDHITPALAQLHWLPVQFRIKFKLCLLMHQIHIGRCPAYLAELVSSFETQTAYKIR